MELYLMQHGSALSREIDPDRKLSPMGRDLIARSAEAVRKMGLGFDAILTSSRTRAVETAALMAAPLHYPEHLIVRTEALAPEAAAEEALNFLGRYREMEDVLVIGHLPSLANLASLLIGPGGTDGQVNIKFDNGALMRIDLEQPEPGGGIMRWYLTTYHLQLIAAC